MSFEEGGPKLRTLSSDAARTMDARDEAGPRSFKLRSSNATFRVASSVVDQVPMGLDNGLGKVGGS